MTKTLRVAPIDFAHALQIMLRQAGIDWLADVKFKTDPDFADVGGVWARTVLNGGTVEIRINPDPYADNRPAVQVGWHSGKPNGDFMLCASTHSLHRTLYDLGAAVQFAVKKPN